MSELQILVVIPPHRAAADDPSPVVLRNLLESLVCRADATRPITWNLPADALGVLAAATESPGFELLEGRIGLFGDRIAPMGLAGTPHVLLGVAEIELDLEWSVRNPWRTGVDQVAPGATSCVLPCDGDLVRGVDAYARAPYTAAVITSASDGEVLVSVASDGQLVTEPLCRFDPAVEWSAGRIGRVVRNRLHGFRRAHAGPADRIIACCTARSVAEAAAAVGTIRLLLESPATFGSRVARTASPRAAVRPGLRMASGPQLTGSSFPWQPEALAAAAADRRARPTRTGTRRTLERLAAPGSPREPGGQDGQPTAVPAGHRRTFVASMIGRAMLAGPGWYALLDEGRFCGLFPDTAVADTAVAAILRLTGTEAEHGVRTDICFSFETDRGNGVRSQVTVLGPGDRPSATVTTDYSFVAELSALVVSVAVRSTAAAREIMLMGLPCDKRAPWGDTHAVTARYPDGSGYRLERLPSEGRLWGHAFGFEGTNANLAAAFVSRSGVSIAAPLVIDGRRDRRVFLAGSPAAGGPAAAGGPPEADASETWSSAYSVLLVPGNLEHELIGAALASRLPKPIRDELAAGPARPVINPVAAPSAANPRSAAHRAAAPRAAAIPAKSARTRAATR